MGLRAHIYKIKTYFTCSYICISTNPINAFMKDLISSKEFYETVDLIITPIILADSETICRYVNKAFLQQIGYQPEEIYDQETWYQKVYNDNDRQNVKETWARLKEAAKKTGESHVHMVTRIRCADGSFKWFDLHESIFSGNKVVTFLDVNELRENNEELTDVLKQKDILLSILAHDVRSPLGNIRQIINNYKNLDMSGAEIEEIFAGMGTQIDYVFNIINALLIRTSAERGNFVEKREPVYLEQFFSKYEDYYHDRMDKQNVHFVFDLPGNVTVDFDPFILDVIARNLIDNAIKFSPENGNIYISFAEKPGYSELSIRDAGVGMSEEQIERILNNKGSRRLKNQITDSFGLGLIMAKEMLERHNGKLGIRSELGKGTSFIIKLLNQ
jgi:PAS domain S-box-containing protein